MARWNNPSAKTKTQKSIFDQADRQANEGMELSYRNAPTIWKTKAQETLVDMCKRLPEFTTDDFWGELAKSGIHTGEPRALGAIIKGAARSGMIRKSGAYVPSTRRHKAPIPIWQSNIYVPTPAPKAVGWLDD